MVLRQQPLAGGSAGPSPAPSSDYNPFGGRGKGSSFRPPGTEDENTTGATPGTYEVNVLDPIGTAQRAKEESEDFLAGLKNALFGTKTPDSEGAHGGLLGGIPVVSDLARFGTQTIGDAGSAAVGAVGGALDAVGGGLEHIDFRSEEEKARMAAAFQSIPTNNAARQKAEDLMKTDPGAAGHYMATALRDYREELLSADDRNYKPDLHDNLFMEIGSAADVVSNLFGFMGLGQRHVERAFAGWDKADGLNRLDAILLVGDGKAVMDDKGLFGTGILGGDGGLDAVEAITYQKFRSGDWSEDDALNFLASHNAGLSSVLALQLAGVVATDPLIWASLGTAGIGGIVRAGASMAMKAERANVVLNETKALLAEAKAIGNVDEVTRLTAEVAKKTQIADDMAKFTLKEQGKSGRLDVLGKLAEKPMVNGVVKSLYEVYSGAQKAHMDGIFKVARSVVDPLSAMGDVRIPGRKLVVDVMTQAGTRMIIGGYGHGNNVKLYGRLASVSPEMAELFTKGMGTYSANLIRRVIATRYRDVAVTMGRADALRNAGDDAVEQVLKGEGVNKAYHEYIINEGNAHRIHYWAEPEIENLGKRLHKEFGTKSASEWTDWIKKEGLNSDEMGLLHAATYGRAQQRLLDVLHTVTSGGVKLDFDPGRVILINKQTLTREGAEGVLKRLNKYKSRAGRMKEWERQRELYPELRDFIVDNTDPNRSIDRIMDQLERRKELLPRQFTDDELKKMPDELSDLHGDTFTLGMAPPDELKWALERSNLAGGDFIGAGPVWVDHVGGEYMAYRPVTQRIAHNITGKPIEGMATKLAKPIDYIDAGIQTMKTQLTGSLVETTARSRFIQGTVHKYRDVGVTEDVAKEMFKKLRKAVEDDDLIVRPSAMTSKNMWAAVEDVLPPGISSSDFNKRDLMNMVLEAYQGDLRHVGITQALSSRVKRVLALDGNNAAHLAESIYPTLKFRLNPVFQAQEKVEGAILNTMRGTRGKLKMGDGMSDADKATELLFQKAHNSSLITNADFEMQEMSQQAGIGKGLMAAVHKPQTPLASVANKLGMNWEALREVKGIKRINMLRAFRKGMGKQMRGIYDQFKPGVWDDMLAEASSKAGRFLDEDEFAIGLLDEMMMGNDIVVQAVGDRLANMARRYDLVDFKAAIEPGVWARPQDLGELRQLNLDAMTELIAIKGLRTAAELRAAIADGTVTVADVTRALKKVGHAHPDYVRRVQRALEFSWTGFFDNLARDYSLTPAQRTTLEDMIATAGKLRGMSPIEYISQVFHPYIVRGEQGALGELGRLAEVVKKGDRAAAKAKKLAGSVEKKHGLATLAVQGGETYDDLVGQLARVFSHHLDPSAKRALMLHFEPELRQRILAGELTLDLNQLDEWWLQRGEDMFNDVIQATANPERYNDFDALAREWTVGEWNQAHQMGDSVMVSTTHNPSMYIPKGEHLGAGIQNAPEEVQKAILRTINRFEAQFPNFKVRHYDIKKMTVANPLDDAPPIAYALPYNDDEMIIILNEDYYNANFEQVWQAADYSNDLQRTMRTSPFGGGLRQRYSFYGASTKAGQATMERTLWHELGHIADGFMTGMRNPQVANRYEAANRMRLAEVRKFIDDYINGKTRRGVSEYAAYKPTEGVAELWSLAFNPNVDLDDFVASIKAAQLSPGMQASSPNGLSLRETDVFLRNMDYTMQQAGKSVSDEWVMYAWGSGVGSDTGFRGRLEKLQDKMDLLQEDEAAGDLAASTIKRRQAKLNKELEDLQLEIDYVIQSQRFPRPKKVELMDPADIDQIKADVLEFRRLLEAAGEYVPSPTTLDPDLMRAVHMFNKWTTEVIGGNLKGGGGPFDAVLKNIAGMPTTNAVPYNYTEHMMLEQIAQAMRDKFDDAHRLHYYARSRNMLERSVNHPFFGIYPASYMWGKMLPEMIRFVAKEPFGVKTGAMAYTLLDVQKAVMMQREFDPEFDKMMEKMGHSAMMFALSYMVPALPWDVNANWSAWLRTFAQQGMDMEARIASGGNISDSSGVAGTGLDPSQPIQRVVDTMNPLKAMERTFVDPLQETTDKGDDEEEDKYGGTYKYSLKGGDTLQGTELGDPLNDVMKQLQSLFGG